MRSDSALEYTEGHHSYLLFLLPVLINTVLVVYTVLRFPQTRLTRAFIFFNLLLITVQIGDGIMHIAPTQQLAETWHKVAFAPW